MDRAIKIFGIALKNDTKIDIKINDHIIFSGKVENNFSLDNIKNTFNLEHNNVTSWIESEMEFKKDLTIHVVKGKFRYTLAKTTYLDEGNTINPKLVNLFSYYDEYGNEVYDPNSNIKINGIPYQYAPPKNRKDLTGQWHIDINEGQIMTCKLHAKRANVRGMEYTVEKVNTKKQFEISVSKNQFKDTYIARGLVTKSNNVRLKVSNLIHDNINGIFIIETHELHGLSVGERIFITDVDVLVKNLKTNESYQVTLFD